MHLRGPMNVSQLAVYQLPAEVHMMKERNIVSFYNRRRALQQRYTYPGANFDEPSQPSNTSPFLELKGDTTTSCSRQTVTSTVTVTDCSTSTSIASFQRNASQGPSLSCASPRFLYPLSPNMSSPSLNSPPATQPIEMQPQLSKRNDVHVAAAS